MPTVYYSHYTPVSDSIPAVCAQEHALGRSLLLCGLWDLCGIRLSKEQLESGLAAGEHGKPYLADRPDIQFNITHCDGLAACAFSAVPVGIDAELPGYFAEVLINKALSEDEKKTLSAAGLTESLRREWFFRFWTLKEAYVKMTGTGVDIPLREISFSFHQVQGSPARLERTSGRPADAVHRIRESELSQGPFSIQCSEPGVRCFQTTLGTGHILSVCTL